MNFPIAASIPYFAYFIFMLFTIPFSYFKSKRQIFVLLVIILCIVSVTYKGEFSDWRTYRAFVESCQCIKCTYFEPGYDLLTFIASKSIGFYLIPVFSLLLFCISIQKLSSYLSANDFFIVTVSLLFAFLPLYFGALRQSIAFSILLLSFYNLYDKKYIKTLFLSIIALLFHSSSIIIFLFFIIYHQIFQHTKNKFKYFILIILFSIPILFFLTSLFFEKLSLIDNFNPGTQNAVVDNTKLLLLPLERIIIALMALRLLYYYKYKKFYVYMCLFSLCGGIFYVIMYSYSLNTAGRVVAFYRLADLFIIYHFIKILLTKKPIKEISDKLNNIAILGIVLYSIVKFYFTIYKVGFFL
jgi:hypothetical protein